MKLRQVVLAARDLEAAVEDIAGVLDVGVPYRDPGIEALGLHNAVFPVGETFLEVISPIKPGTTAGRFLERRGGDGGYMAMLQTDDFSSAVERITAQGVRIVLRVDLDDMHEVHLHPRDLPGAIVSVSTPQPADAWRWGGPTWRDHMRTEVVHRAVEVVVEAPDPRDTAARWAGALGLTVADVDRAPTLSLEGGAIEFVPLASLPSVGIVRYGFASNDPERALVNAQKRGLPARREDDGASVMIAGTWLRLRRLERR